MHALAVRAVPLHSAVIAAASVKSCVAKLHHARRCQMSRA